METPLDLPLSLMAFFKVMVLMPSDHKILIPVEDATFGLQVEYIYVSKEDVFKFLRMKQISTTCIVVHMK